MAHLAQRPSSLSRSLLDKDDRLRWQILSIMKRVGCLIEGSQRALAAVLSPLLIYVMHDDEKRAM